MTTYTTFDPDNLQGATLSGGNLVATNSVSADGGAKCVHLKKSGLLYFELLFNALSGGDSGGGICGSGASFASLGADATFGAIQFKNGNTYLNGSLQFGNGAVSSQTLCVAVDFTHQKVWLRVNGGNWNNGVIGVQNPATNTGGMSTSAFDQAGLMIVALVTATGETATLNAGGSAFAFTMPSGFTGWDNTTPESGVCAYGNAGGTGNRTSTVTATSTLTISGTFNHIVNGNKTENNMFFNGSSVGQNMKFDFGVGAKKAIDRFRWYQSNTVTGGTTWQWYGSDDDSSYTALGNIFSLVGRSDSQPPEILEPSCNAVGYRYYKLQLVSGSTSSSPWIDEIEFHIGNALINTNIAWVSTEAKDIFNATSSPFGTWGSTELKDIFASLGYPKLTGVIAATEAKDVFHATGHDLFLDGNATNVSTSTVGSGTVTLTTLAAHDVIVLTVTTKGATVSSVADVAGLVWNLRTRYAITSGGNPAGDSNMEIWWAHAPAALTADVITLTFSGSTKYEANAFGVCGANVAAPFDAHNANSITATNSGSGNPTIAITTDFLHDQFIFGVYGSDLVSESGVSTGMTTHIGSLPAGGTGNLNNGVGYVLKHAPQTALSLSFGQVLGGGANRYLMADAIVAAIDIFGTMGATETKDHFAGTGLGPPPRGTLGATEAKDIMNATVFMPPRGTMGAVEAKDIFGFTGSTTAPLSVDAHATGVSNDSASASVTLTTTHTNDVIVLGIFTGGHWDKAKVGSVTDTAGLVWKKRNQRWVLGDDPNMEIWWAKKAAIGATTITVHTLSSPGDPVGATQTGNNTGFLCIDAIAITGANADKPWDTHTGAGWFTDSFGNMRFGANGDTGTVARYYSNASKGMALAFYCTVGRPSTGVATAGTDWTWLERVATTESAGQTGTLESAYKVFDTRRFDDWFQLTEDTGALGNHSIMQDIIVAANDPHVADVSTDDVIRWFFDGPGQQTIVQLSGSLKSQSLALSTFQRDTICVVGVMVQSSLGARVASVTDDGGHSPGWERRASVVGVPGSLSLETWWCHFPTAFTGNITVTLDDSAQAGDIIGFVAVGINGPDAFQRGEIWDGDASLPKTNKDSGSASYQTTGNFSSLNADVLEINFAANTGSFFADGGLEHFNEDPWMQFHGDFFGSQTGILNSAAPNFNVALQFKFNAAVVNNDHTELNVTPAPDKWLMISDVMPVGPAIPPSGVWGSVETKDHTSHNGNFTAIGIANGPGWVGFPPNHAVMAATDQKDRATNTGAFFPVWDTNGWIGFLPLFMAWHSTDTKDVWHAPVWVLGPTTILARWESVERKDSFGFSSVYTWYTTPDSRGDRTSRITVTSNAVLGGSSGPVTTLVNGLRGNNAASGCWVENSQPAPMWFRFDFLTPKVVNEALFFQTGPSSQHGLWVWQGSNDATTWATLSVPFNFDGGNSGSPVLGDFSSNGTAYRYYQVIQTTLAGGQDLPWLWEFEFKVAGFSGTMGATEAKDNMNYQIQLIPKVDPIPPRKNRLLIVT